MLLCFAHCKDDDFSPNILRKARNGNDNSVTLFGLKKPAEPVMPVLGKLQE
jgi:hypothetical protein